MVQVNKERVKREEPGLKQRETRAQVNQGFRKAAPVQRKRTVHDKKVSGAIGRNIETIMAARVAHEGGHLRVIAAPENVDEYVKSGPKMSALQISLRSTQNAARRSKANKHQQMIKKQLHNEIDRLENKPEDAEVDDEKAAKLLKRRAIIPSVAELADDDVAGNFFDDEIGEGFNPVVEVHKDIGIKAPIKKVVKKPKLSETMPGRKSGFKGVTKKDQACVLDAAF